MNTYIINEWNQLCSIPQNSLGYKITVEHFRTNSDIGITINVEKNNIKMVTLPVQYTTTASVKPYIFSKVETLNIINSFGFDIKYYDTIILNNTEIITLTSVYNLGYSYIQLINIGNNNKIIISKQPINSYDTNKDFIELSSLVDYDNNSFKWMELFINYSIALLLEIDTDKDCNCCGK